ncbi:hypothetical protein TNCV_3140601 [Trichonephila clavipes]|nr:hypothetical protein TNCV_3140601 [Trichonephila clavipes]
MRACNVFLKYHPTIAWQGKKKRKEEGDYIFGTKLRSFVFEGLLGKNLVMLNPSQVTRTTLEMASQSLYFHMVPL